MPAVKWLALVPVAVACTPSPTLKTNIDRMLDGQKYAQTAKDPDEKAYWQGVYECSTRNALPSSPADMQKGADNDYRKCLDANAMKVLGTLHTRAEGQKSWHERSVTLRLAKCIEDHDKTGSFAPFASMEECTAKASVAEDTAASSARSDWDDAEKKNGPNAWLEFLAKHPDDDRIAEAARRVLKAANSADEATQLTLDDKLALAYPPIVPEIPAERRVLIVGPKGMRVRDIQKMRAAKVADSIVLARIKTSKQPYKSFDADELGVLKKLEMSDELVTAMIEVTTKITESNEAEQDRRAMRAEIESLKKLVADKKKNETGQVVQTKDGPLDVAASCAKRLAAMKLCEQIPFPGSTICSSGVESEFPCPAKL